MMGALLRFVGIRPTVAPTFARESLPVNPRAPRWALQRAPRGPVLMLDIDGVLHPGQSGTLIYLPLLETWLRAHPDVDVVISSNWRETHTLDELRNFFSIELRERVIGCTPVLPDCTRLDEILCVVRE
ncbi:HAD domain-containing protein, partial [Escherichia coli]|nr:HAD domain-containing protein [Escherichia coli]